MAALCSPSGHLGGPDTITAFSLEDNELWRRHLLHFIAQTFATANILYQMPPPVLLWVPTTLVFLCGLIKYGERVLALYCTSLDKFRRSILREPDPGPNYAMFMGEYAQKMYANFPTKITIVEEPELEQDLRNFEVTQKGGRLLGPQVVKDAYRFYQRFKGLIVDFEYGFREHNKSVHYFLSLQEDDAFRVVETKLGFVYDAFYTKAVILHQNTFYAARGFCLCLMLISLGIFFLWEKVEYKAEERLIDPKHVPISYTLLLGAIALDIIFSNWSVAILVKDYETKQRSICKTRQPSVGVEEQMVVSLSRVTSSFAAPFSNLGMNPFVGSAS